MQICFRPSLYDVTQINVRFQLLVTRSSPCLPMKFGVDIFIQSGVIDIFSKIKDGGRRHLGFILVSHGTILEASFL